jgi:hypothetical protein
MTRLWVSSPKGTCFVNTDDNTIIVDTAPLWRKFKGQPLGNLIRWLGKDVRVEYLDALKEAV